MRKSDVLPVSMSLVSIHEFNRGETTQHCVTAINSRANSKNPATATTSLDPGTVPGHLYALHMLGPHHRYRKL